MLLIKPKDLAYCSVLGAAALLLPVVFHALHLGHVFMPMYLPLILLAFFVPPLPAALTALVVPLLSAVVTGMPPFNPPVALVMTLELVLATLFIASILRSLKKVTYCRVFLLLMITLMAGRVFYTLIFYLLLHIMQMNPKPLALLAFIGGWPGVILMLAVIPRVVMLSQPYRNQTVAEEAK